MIKSRWFIV